MNKNLPQVVQEASSTGWEHSQILCGKRDGMTLLIFALYISTASTLKMSIHTTCLSGFKTAHQAFLTGPDDPNSAVICGEMIQQLRSHKNIESSCPIYEAILIRYGPLMEVISATVCPLCVATILPEAQSSHTTAWVSGIKARQAAALRCS